MSRPSVFCWAIPFLGLVLLIRLSGSEYIPPGPKYPCPADRMQVYPCVCLQGGDTGLVLHCNRTNLASLSIGLNNARSPIDELVIAHSKIHRLYGPVFHGVEMARLVIMDTPLQTIEKDAFLGVSNTSLRQIQLLRTELTEFPVEALSVLSSMTALRIDGSALTSVAGKSFVGLHLDELRLTNGQISELKSDSFAGLDKLKTLDLHDNLLTDIPKGCFQPLRNLEVLDIGGNNLTKLQPTYFADLAKLISVNVSRNGLSDYPRGVFARNTVLRVVNLSGNGITKLDANSFRGMRFLRRLYMSDNQISEIGRGTFGAVSRIGTIDLARNRITKIDFQMFHELNLCEHIDVSDNLVTEIQRGAFKDIYLAKINISYNQLSSVEAGSFVNCANLTLLDMSHNKLSRFSRTTFDSTTYPHEFRLEFNEFTNMSSIPFDNMTGIAVLNISYNQLVVLPKKTFPKLYELHTVDLSHNELSDIDGSALGNLFNLRYLNLSHNNLTSLSGSTIGTSYTLIDLDLSHNALKDVARAAFTRLSSIRSLRLQHNNISSIFQLPIALNELNLADNAVSKIPGGRIWPVMNALLQLDLSNNRLGDNLEPGSFANLITLQSLNLANNSISVIPVQALSDLPSIQFIYLDNNRLTELNRAAFGRLPVVFQLGLSRNNISTVSDRAFEGLLQLLHLNLSQNAIDYIPPGAFHGLVSLRTLDLSYNRLEKLDNKTHSLLEDCLSLERVNLSHNQISFLTSKTFPESPWTPYRLAEVDLSHNQMPVISKEILIGTKKVRQLNLRGNLLNEIRPGVISNMTNLERLDLSHNELTSLPKGTLGILPNLTVLELSHNLLLDIPVAEIAATRSLSFVDLRSNRLSRFYDELMPLIEENGTVVLMQDNPVKCDCRLRPLQFWLSGRDGPDPWDRVICSQPAILAGQSLATVPDESLTCGREAQQVDRNKYAIVKDVVFRQVVSSGSTIDYNWFVQTREDVSDFQIEVRPLLPGPPETTSNSRQAASTAVAVEPQPDLVIPAIATKEVGYGLRADRITGVEDATKYVVCIRARTSLGQLRPWKPNQCQRVATSSSPAVNSNYAILTVLSLLYLAVF